MSFERVSPQQHDTLEDVPEPAENPNLFGHGEALARLAAAYREGRLAHALVLAGKSGIGKATLAFRFAGHVLDNPRQEAAPVKVGPPDPAGRTFRLIAQGAHPSLLHLTRPPGDRGKGFRSALTVDEIRRVGRFVSMTAHDGGHRIVIVDPADDMNANAANALLKNLEEPPPRCLFLLIVHRPGRLLATIRSRCQMLRLDPLGDDDLTVALQAVGAALPEEPDARRTVLAQAGGSVRDALMLTRFDGLDIVSALGGIVAAKDFAVPAAYGLADAVSAKDDGQRFAIFGDALLAEAAGRARRAAAEGPPETARRLSELWRQAGEDLTVGRVYNLDRRQLVVGLLRRLHDAARA